MSRLSRVPSARGLPRALPWESGMTRMWTGTKILCLTLLSTGLLLWPQWTGLAAVAAAMLVGTVVARVPVSALPRFPAWFWGGVAGGMIGAAIASGFLLFLRATLIGAVVLWGTVLLVWTTPLERMTPALRTLMAPLRLVGVPVDEWATTMGFALRGLPAIQDQTSAVIDTVKLRSGGRVPVGFRAGLRIAVDVVTASLSAASRRAVDTGRAMTLRGGVPEVPVSRERAGWRDLVALVVTVGAVVAAYLLRSGWPESWGSTLDGVFLALRAWVSGWMGAALPGW